MPSIFESSQPELFRAVSQRVEVVAEEFQRDLGADAREHVVEPVRDRLPDIDRERQHRKPGADVGDDLGLRPLRALEIDFELGGMDAFGVLVQFRAPGAPSDADHLRHVEQKAFGDRAHSRWIRQARCPG